jgi:hypothetical protein
LSYEYLWKELEALVVELRSKGKDVPKDVVEDLKSARTLMSIQRVDPSSPVGLDVEEYLRMTEAALMSSAEYHFGKRYADQWLRRLEEAKAKGLRETPKRQVGFVAGIPKGNDWVRVKVTELIDMKELDSMAEGLGLSKRIEEEDTMLLYGPPEKVKAFMKELTERVKRK